MYRPTIESMRRIYFPTIETPPGWLSELIDACMMYLDWNRFATHFGPVHDNVACLFRCGWLRSQRHVLFSFSLFLTLWLISFFSFFLLSLVVVGSVQRCY